jgi:RHS repeat-associated protein
VTRSGTTTVGRYDYSAFGLRVGASGPEVCRFQFSSKERDPATGWSYYGYRYYAPHWQRWPSRDPMGSSEGPNLYGFCGNRPIANLDVDGRSVFGMILIVGLLQEGSCFAAAAAIGMNYSFPRDSHEHKRHCLVGCLTARICGAGSTVDGAAQVIKEIFFGIKDHGWPWNWDWKELWKDTAGWGKGHARGMIPGPACGCFKACNTSDLDS